MDSIGYNQLIEVLQTELDGFEPVVRSVPEEDQNIPIFTVGVNRSIAPHRFLDALNRANEQCDGLKLRAILIGNATMTLADVTKGPNES